MTATHPAPTIPAAVAAHIAPDTPALVAIVEGVGCCSDLSPKDLIGVPAHKHANRPPADLRALADADCPDCPCPACGRGSFDYDADQWHGCTFCEDDPCSNPLCDPDRPGKLLAEVRVECDHDEATWDEDTGYGCCSDKGYRTVTGRIAVEPIMDVEHEVRNNRTIDDVGPCIYLGDTHDGQTWFYFDGEDHTPILIPESPAAVALADIHGPPDTWPGKYALVLTEVKR